MDELFRVVPQTKESVMEFMSGKYVFVSLPTQGGNFHLKVGGAKSSGNAGDPMLGVAVIP